MRIHGSHTLLSLIIMALSSEFQHMVNLRRKPEKSCPIRKPSTKKTMYKIKQNAGKAHLLLPSMCLVLACGKYRWRNQERWIPLQTLSRHGCKSLWTQCKARRKPRHFLFDSFPCYCYQKGEAGGCVLHAVVDGEEVPHCTSIPHLSFSMLHLLMLRPLSYGMC